MMQRDRLIGIVVKNPPAVFWAKGTGHDGKPWQINVGSAGELCRPRIPDTKTFVSRTTLTSAGGSTH